jgi:hypothetical protein
LQAKQAGKASRCKPLKPLAGAQEGCHPVTGARIRFFDLQKERLVSMNSKPVGGKERQICQLSYSDTGSVDNATAWRCIKLVAHKFVEGESQRGARRRAR